jgi:UDP-2,4-diacetamido-2,4,6-trideoxy-beta-L-altropyranose hydrolase
MLLIRADASPAIGTGHVMRCLALAQAWEMVGGKTVFAMAVDAPGIESRLQSEGYDVRRLSVTPGGEEDADLTANLALSLEAAFVVVDGYHFGSQYQKRIKDAVLRLLFIDDFGHANFYWADLVLNQNLHARKELYLQKAPYTKILQGSPFILLRKEFWPWRGQARYNSEAIFRVLITLGGSDPDNVTLKVIDYLQYLFGSGVELMVVAGGGNVHNDVLEAASRSSRVPVQLLRNVTDMPDLMAKSDLAISSGGTTAWEMAFMGLPCLIIVLADNQAEVARNLQDTGAAMNLGWHEELTCRSVKEAVEDLRANFSCRNSMSIAGQQLIDGFGVNRVIMTLIEEIVPMRDATFEDCVLIFGWANDVEARRSSFSTISISWDEHQKWFEQKLHETDCILLICMDNKGHSFGIVRFDIQEDDALISINLDRNARGKGLAGLTIIRTVIELLKRRRISSVNAFIKPQNLRSIKAFERAGFTRISLKQVKGCDAWHYSIDAKILDYYLRMTPAYFGYEE